MSKQSTHGVSVRKELAQKLYSIPPGSTGSTRLPGPDAASEKMLVEKLLHNQEHFHTYFNDKGFHNHSTHHLFAIYGLGAPPELIAAAYESHAEYLKPIVHSPHEITDADFVEHLGDEEYYNAYHAYFLNYLSNHTTTEALEKFIFAPEYNYIPGAKKQPEMLNRCLAGLFHPLIHVGYGVEFEVKGQLAEGLAMTAVHIAHQTRFVPYSLFSSHQEFSTAPITSLLNRLASLTLGPGGKPFSVPKPKFTLHQRILEDPVFEKAVSPHEDKKYEYVVEHQGDTLHKLVAEWDRSWLEGAKTNEEVEARLEVMVEEVIWGQVLFYGVAATAGPGIKPGRDINADFFLMHLVTSALFLPTYILPLSASNPAAINPPLSLAHRLLLLRTYLATSLGWYIARGRPAVPLADFYAKTQDRLRAPSPPSPPPRHAPPAQGPPPPAGPLPAAGSPWPRIIQNTLVHPNEHLCKLQRALAFFATLYGSREQGYFAGAALKGAEQLDGTLFVRVAGLTMDRLGLANEGGQLDVWDFVGFFGVDRPVEYE